MVYCIIQLGSNDRFPHMFLSATINDEISTSNCSFFKDTERLHKRNDL